MEPVVQEVQEMLAVLVPVPVAFARLRSTRLVRVALRQVPSMTFSRPVQ